MSGTSLIVAEVFVGIMLLMVVGGALGVIVPRMLGESASADELLRRRYARGELTREQYLQMRDDLGLPAPAGMAAQTREPAATG